MAVGLVIRAASVIGSRSRADLPRLARIDVLTSAGASLGWLSASAIILAVWLGWASLAVVGLLGTALFHLVVLFAFATLRGQDPMRSSTVTRRFSPDVVTEGDDVTEQVLFSGTRIPIGYRLFVSGRIGPRWPQSRHVLDASESGGEVVLESNLGPALRGEHEAEPLEVWLQDTFGLCRSMRVEVGRAHLTVLPRISKALKTAPLLERGDGPRAPRPAARLPTEGHFRLREYQRGDDVRRIHWVRSAAAREIVVRLPDEIPPDRPRVRVVLDTFFPEGPALTCDGPAEQLDAAVGVWLAVARSLAESGAQVTLVAALPQGTGVAVVREHFSLRAPTVAQRLGARAVWQGQIEVGALLTEDPTFVVSRAILARPPEDGHVRWVLVAHGGVQPPAWPTQAGARFPYPMGSAENRWTLRRREANRLAIARRDHARCLVTMRAGIVAPPPGSFVAVALHDGTIRLDVSR
jgi:uncharacterized protein (DUF58 family)